MDKIELWIWEYILETGHIIRAFEDHIPETMGTVVYETKCLYVLYVSDFKHIVKQTKDITELAYLVHDWCINRDKEVEYNRFVDELINKYVVTN